MTQNIGFPFHYIFRDIEEIFDKNQSGIKDAFKDFLKSSEPCDNWMLCSDYVLGDTGRERDVLCFTLIPRSSNPEGFEKRLRSLCPKDIKNTKKVNTEFLQFLWFFPSYSFVFRVDKHKKLHTDEKELINSMVDGLVEQNTFWAENQEDYAGKFNRTISRLLKLKEYVNSKSPSIKVIRYILLVCYFVIFIFKQLKKSKRLYCVGWFSDRDVIIDFKLPEMEGLPLIYNLVSDGYHVLASDLELSPREKEIFFFDSSTCDEDLLLLDTYNRIPDLICGAVSSYNENTGECSHNKYNPVVNSFVKLSNKVVVFDLKLSGDHFSASVDNKLTNNSS